MKNVRIIASLSLVAVAAGASPAKAATAYHADIIGFSYSPNPLVVNVGDSVQWTNVPPNADHTATVDATPSNSFGFDTGIIAPAESSGAITMTMAGTYQIYCGIHGTSMTQQLVVQEALPSDVPEAPIAALFGVCAAALFLSFWIRHRRRSLTTR